jgi:hypothetical protein
MLLLVPLFLLIAMMVVGLLVAGVVVVVRRVRYSVTGSQGEDARELRTYVHTFARTLSTLGVSHSARRRHVDELKANLAEAVAADGIRAALEGLGPAGALATGYADYRPRPGWVVGVAAAVLTWLVTVFVQVQYGHAYAAGLTDAFGIGGGEVLGNTVHEAGWGVTLSAVLHGGANIDVHVSSPWLWMLPIVAFFIASRSWRTLTMRNAATVKA